MALALFVFLLWTPAAYAWSWPVQGPVLQPFSYDESHPYAAGQHRGIDIGADNAGETVVAPAAGTVSFAGTIPTSGKSVTIETADGYSVTLTHLGSTLVAKGAVVAERDPVGTIGPSGTPEVDGPYVHLGVRLTTDSNGYVDPAGLLPSLPAGGSTTNDTAASQPSSSGGSATASGGVSSASTSSAPAPATTEPASSEPASQPVSGSLSSQATPVRTRESSHARGQTQQPRAEMRSSRPLGRPEVLRGQEATATARNTRPASSARAASAPRRPVVETAAFSGPNRLDAGHESRFGHPVSQPSPARQPVPGTLLPLFLNGAAAIFAVGAAFVGALGRRRRRGTVASAEVEVLHLPVRALDDRPVSRAA